MPDRTTLFALRDARRLGLLCGALALALASGVQAQSLRADRASLDLQNRQAALHGFGFLRNPGELRSWVEEGLLVPVDGNGDYRLKEVSFPYARPEVKDFVERLGTNYRRTCGEPLVVTSLTRPRNRQPRNASSRSVHPTGMALDLRRSWSRPCRSWLEQTLLTLESRGVLDATLEREPIHYHLALFPRPYRQQGPQILESGLRTHYQVGRGDTLFKIAYRLQTTVAAVKEANGLRSNRIYAGQVLKLPTSQ